MESLEQAKIISQTAIASNQWLNLSVVEWVDESGRRRHWECANRNRQQGAVMIIPLIEPQNELVLVRQFRPPAHGYTIEFPAGLIDPGEDAVTAAERELYEECGYEGKLIFGGLAALSSPGLSGEEITPIMMKIDGEKYPLPVKNHQEETEHIEVFRVKMTKMRKFIGKMQQAGCKIDSKVYCFMLAQELAGIGGKCNSDK
ncbi:MAG: NUDIX hydrolase [Lentisphaeria bacterium]|nr:NUDIX hydrolase [Lentisphaeria bacterium]